MRPILANAPRTCDLVHRFVCKCHHKLKMRSAGSVASVKLFSFIVICVCECSMFRAVGDERREKRRKGRREEERGNDGKWKGGEGRKKKKEAGGRNPPTVLPISSSGLVLFRGGGGWWVVVVSFDDRAFGKLALEGGLP